MRRIGGLPARIALVVAAGALLVAIGVALLLVNTERYATQPAEAERDDIAIVTVRFTGSTQPLTERASVSRAGASSSHSAKNPPTTSSR